MTGNFMVGLVSVIPAHETCARQNGMPIVECAPSPSPSHRATHLSSVCLYGWSERGKFDEGKQSEMRKDGGEEGWYLPICVKFGAREKRNYEGSMLARCLAESNSGNVNAAMVQGQVLFKAWQIS